MFHTTFTWYKAKGYGSSQVDDTFVEAFMVSICIDRVIRQFLNGREQREMGAVNLTQALVKMFACVFALLILIWLYVTAHLPYIVSCPLRRMFVHNDAKADSP
jgi:hypothetical protein